MKVPTLVAVSMLAENILFLILFPFALFNTAKVSRRAIYTSLNFCESLDRKDWVQEQLRGSVL